MKSNPDPDRPVSVLRIEHELLEKVLTEYPNLIAEVDNRAARAIRWISRFSESPLPDTLIDSEGELHVSLEGLETAYAITKNESEYPDPRLELDFPSHPAHVRIWDIAQRESHSLPDLLSSLFAYDSTSLDTLNANREESYPVQTVCPCCEDKARERAHYASLHPLFDILMQATRKSEPLHARVLSPFADYSIPLLPYQVETHEGIISAVDTQHHSAFHVDLRSLYSMRIKQVRLDGERYTQLIGYNSFGAEIFHLASPDPEDAAEWTQCCEWSKQFFTSLGGC